MDRTVAEVGASYPGFALRGLDWEEICRDHAPEVLAAADPLAAAQRWTARLQDVHTGIEPVSRPTPLPYVVAVRDGSRDSSACRRRRRRMRRASVRAGA